MAPKCALNEDTDDPSDWEGSDDDNWLMRWRIKKKHWFAFSNRCPKGVTWTIVFFPFLYIFPFTVWFTGLSWWYLLPVIILPVSKKWRDMPIVLFAIKGRGPWRVENTNSTSIISCDKPRLPNYYLSRVQRWTRWHIQIQWPLFIAAHFYFRAKDVPSPIKEFETDGTLFNFYRGYHRDEDRIFWGDGGFIGLVWK